MRFNGALFSDFPIIPLTARASRTIPVSTLLLRRAGQWERNEQQEWTQDRLGFGVAPQNIRKLLRLESGLTTNTEYAVDVRNSRLYLRYSALPPYRKSGMHNGADDSGADHDRPSNVWASNRNTYENSEHHQEFHHHGDVHKDIKIYQNHEDKLQRAQESQYSLPLPHLGRETDERRVCRARDKDI
ncbi:hypothetical protein NMY22_g2852 [Coprinellus aureogranulatus]|nr:hypothetical protein NMY22_g2852 [Coprinellus aureogranulatus]